MRREKRITRAFETNSRDLLRYLERRLGADAADALSETMLIAWQRATKIPGDAAEARLWLFGIARNVSLNFERSRRRRSRLAAQLFSTFERGSSEAPGADEGYEIREALTRMEPDLAEIVRAVHWDGFTLAEFSQIAGIPASTVRSRYQKAKSLLAEEFAAAPAPREG